MKTRWNLLRIIALVALLGSSLVACRSKTPTDTPGRATDTAEVPTQAVITATPLTPTQPAASPTPMPPTNPILVERYPERGEEALVDAAIEVRFDQAMDQSSVENALTVSSGGEAPLPVEGKIDWPDEATLRFSPLRPLDRDTSYQVNVGPEAKSKVGLALQREVAFDFVTVGYLEVSQVIPAPDSSDTSSDTTITVMFNRPVVPLISPSDPASERLPQPLQVVRDSDGVAVEGIGEWLNTSIYFFRPAEPLRAGQRYTARVPAGLEDTTGGVLANDYAWSFSVAPPSVVWTTPQEGKDQVRPTDIISVTFSQPMDHASVERAFSLRWNDPKGPSVDGRFQWAKETEARDTQVGFVPREPLELESTYYAAITTEAMPMGGGTGLLDDYEWSFDTVPYPRIVDTEPIDGDNAAPPGTGFQIRFSAPIDPKTVLPQVTIVPTPTQVYTYWSEYSYQYTLSYDALPSTNYEVRIAPGVSDPLGNTIDEETVVAYATRALDPMAWFNVPGTVGHYNAYADTELFAYYRNISALDVSLYAMPLDDFLRVTGATDGDSWTAWQEYSPMPEDLIRRWSEEIDAELDETALVRLRPAGPDGGPLPPGIYYLELYAPELPEEDFSPSRHVMVVSRTQLTLKLAQQEALVWATDLSTGEPVQNLPITLGGQRPFNSQLTANTDGDGLARFTWSSAVEVWTQRYALAGAEPYGDAFAVTLSEWAEGISPWDFDIDSRYQIEPYTVYFYTDRPIYRPGQPVYFKGIVRRDDDARYEIPQDLKELTVEVRDDEGKLVYDEVLPINEMGTVNGQFDLDEETRLGQYYLSTIVKDDADREYGYGIGFRVAEYRKPEFQVELTTDRDQYLADESIDVLVEASYFFGGPTPNATVQWSLLTSDYAFQWSGRERYDWVDTSTYRAGYGEYYYGGFGELIADGEGKTDAQGRFVFSIPADISDRSVSQSFTIEATVTDLNDQAVSTRTSVIVHKGEFYVGLHPQRYVGKVGDELQVDVRTVDWNSAPWPQQDLTITLNQRTWYSVREEDSRGRLFWTWSYTDTAVFTETLTTDTEGTAVVNVRPPEGGSYVVRAVGRDKKGNEARSSTFFWVSSRDYISWRIENNDRIDLIADKDSYKPGETATIMVPSPFQGQVKALLTLERGRILESRVVTLSSNSELFQIPVTADMAPNVYVSIVLVKGMDETNPMPAFKTGYAAFEVSTEQQLLNLTIRPDKDISAGETYQPRESATYEIRATDYQGQPVQAELSLNLTDLAVLSLAEPNAPALSDFFYGRRGLGIRTATGLTLAVDRLNERIVEEVKGGGGGAVSADLEIRRDFPDTVYWAPTVRTNEDGLATVQVDLPDSLTTWRMIGKAITSDTLVGEGQVDIVSTKELLIRPVTPRFFVAGDRAELAAVVHNNTSQDLSVAVALQADGLDLESEPTQNISVPVGGQIRVDWQVSVPNAPESDQYADLTFSVQGGDWSDASKPTLGIPPDQLIPVYKYSTPEVVGTAGHIDAENGEARAEAIVLPSNVDPTQGDLVVNVAPSLAAGLTEGLNYLEHYPYECTEQTVSRFLPNVLTYRALRDLDLVDQDLESNLRQQVTVGLQRLYNGQHADGGWGWWINDESDAAVTSWVVFGLVKAQQAGFSVDEQVLEAATGYLRDELISPMRMRDSYQANRQAFILYVLAEAGQPDPGRTSVLFDNREKLDHYGKAYLALAFDRIDPQERAQIRTLLSDLNSAAVVSATGVHWQESERDWWNWNTDRRSTAIILDALAQLDPDNDLAPNVVRWLMSERKDGRWETTQETAWSLIALTDWMVASQELEGSYGWGAELNGQLLGQDNVTRENLLEETAFRVAVVDLLRDQANRLVIEKGPGPGSLYYAAHLRTFIPVEEVRALNRGIIVGRQYTLDSCKLEDLEEGEVCPTVDSAHVGETVRVKLTIIAPNDLHYVVIEDPIPAGTEAVDINLETSSITDEGPALEATDVWSSYGWGWWWFTHSELRDEKAVLFATYLPAGTYEYSYLIRPSLAGQYRVLPTTAYEMYFPEVFGRGDGTIFQIAK
jgi:uncharacterized protein YfaS (alpha-2-macroglobulin family)